MKSIRILFAATLVVVLALTFTAAAHAQSALKGEFHLDQDVQWGDAVLPSGDYNLSVSSAQMPMQILVRDVHGKVAAMFVSNIADAAESGDSALYVITRGNERRIRAINLPQLGLSLHYERLTRDERRELDMAKNQGVSLEVARK